ncbi:MAG: VOC family protein [bacterium]|nr:VOC family protein [bacterium]
MSGEFPKGRFVWFDLMTEDPAGGQDFYTQLIGWQTEVWDGGEKPYTMWKNGETSIGGVVQLPDEAKRGGAPSHWLGYVAVPDVDASAEKIKELGGQILNGPMEVPGGGRIVQAMDPQGAAFALHTPGAEQAG